jgi:hypothetical protein
MKIERWGLLRLIREYVPRGITGLSTPLSF